MKKQYQLFSILSGFIILALILYAPNIGAYTNLNVNIDMNRTYSKWIGNYYQWNGKGTITGSFNGDIIWKETGFLVAKDTFNGVVKGQILTDNSNSSYQIGTQLNPYIWKPTSITYSYLGEYTLKGKFFINGSYVCVIQGYADGDWEETHIRSLTCS